MLKLADTSLILINPSPSNVNVRPNAGFVCVILLLLEAEITIASRFRQIQQTIFFVIITRYIFDSTHRLDTTLSLLSAH